MILSAIAAETGAQEGALLDIRREIALLMEYRTRLITDVVTGKGDVREAAARLPLHFEEPEPLDESEAEPDSEETDDASESPTETET